MKHFYEMLMHMKFKNFVHRKSKIHADSSLCKEKRHKVIMQILYSLPVLSCSVSVLSLDGMFREEATSPK